MSVYDESMKDFRKKKEKYQQATLAKLNRFFFGAWTNLWSGFKGLVESELRRARGFETELKFLLPSFIEYESLETRLKNLLVAELGVPAEKISFRHGKDYSGARTDNYFLIIELV